MFTREFFADTFFAARYYAKSGSVGTSTAIAVSATYRGSCTLELFTGETPRVTVTLTDQDGSTVDVSNFVFSIIFEAGSTEVTIGNADVTKGTSSFAFDIPAAITTVARLWTWSARNTDDNGIIIRNGISEVSYSPQ
jgi:hypothetical protein